MDAIGWINVVLAVVAAVAAVGSIAAMNGGTSHLVRIATVLILVGVLAQSIGTLVEQWERYADTAMFGGVAVLLLANRRVPTCMLERHARPLGVLVAAVAGAVAIFGMVAAL